MAMSKIPILKPVVTGYRDAWSAISAMPVFAIYVVLVMLAANLIEYFYPAAISGTDFVAALVSIVVSAVQNFFLTPIMIAVHRYIILEQITPAYLLQPGERTFRVFFTWLMLLSALPIFAVPLVAVLPIGLVGVMFMVMVIVSLRLSILFPAIAVDAPGASPGCAWYDSKKNTFRILLIFALSVMPLMLGALVFVVPFQGLARVEESTTSIPRMIGLSVVQMFYFILFVAIASRLYQALADRLLGHARSPV